MSPGDLVGVVQKKDPTGDVSRWFVDNGVSQGFVPARILVSVGEFDMEKEVAQRYRQRTDLLCSCYIY